MGEVYRARDARLNRDVALKVLPELFALDPDRLARFRREAQLLASLNHPNIGAIHGLEESNSVQALVLELVEGPTLADRIASGPVPAEEAVPIARQIADALESAHEQGIIHRDLKPANIKLRPDGMVKVLDFGLAKALDTTDPVSGSVTMSPTITSPALTQMGVILGTAAYMSPEQVKGRPADKRSDVWAFGAVLYEMLTGERPFKGDDMADTLAAVLRQNVDMTALPASTPASVRRLIARCLDRDVKRRLRDIGEARIALEETAAPGQEEDAAAAVARVPRPLWQRALPMVLAAVVAGTAVGAAVWLLNSRSIPPATVSRSIFALPDGERFTGAIPHHVLALSPDGTQMVYASNNRLYLRSMSEFEAREIQGTQDREAAWSPVFAPDGQSLLFYATSERAIKKIALTGGNAATICAAAVPWGISWEPEGIVFGQGRDGVMRVSPDGGQPTVVARVKDGEVAHGPQLLPGGQHVIFTLASGNEITRWDRARIVVQPVGSGEQTTIFESGSDARYLPTGHIVFGSSGRLFAAPFDLRRLTIGSAVPMVEDVMSSGGRSTGAYHYSVARNGSLIYAPGNAGLSREPWEVVITDRKGAIERLKIPPDRYIAPRASPDGTRVVIGADDGKEAIVYTWELSGTSGRERLTYGSNNRFPIWSSDGKRIAFQSDREKDVAIWQTTPGGTAERLTKPEPGESHAPEDWHPKDDVLLYSVTKGPQVTLWTLSLRDGKAARFSDIQSEYPTGARFHPTTGRWVAYTRRESDISTRVFVEPFPATGFRRELPVGGALAGPHKIGWSRDGTELFYIPRIFEFEAVTVRTEPTLAFGLPVILPRPFNPGPPNGRTLYDVLPGGRFLGLIPPGRTDAIPRFSREIRVVLNWSEDLKARVPAR
jgi:serine/threonine-protein kinase